MHERFAKERVPSVLAALSVGAPRDQRRSSIGDVVELGQQTAVRLIPLAEILLTVADNHQPKRLRVAVEEDVDERQREPDSAASIRFRAARKGELATSNGQGRRSTSNRYVPTLHSHRCSTFLREKTTVLSTHDWSWSAHGP
eukprot:1374544-Rhodomonas_salina.1